MLSSKKDTLKSSHPKLKHLNKQKDKSIELEEDVEINFDTKKYLPNRFNVYKGLHDIDWKLIEVVELEEDIELGFNNQNNLPEINCKSNTNAIIVSRL